LVPSPAAPATCFDLRRGCSLAEHLLQGGRRAYGLDYGRIDFDADEPSLEPYVAEALPRAIRRASEDAGGSPVGLVAWSLGGIMALLALAADPALPVASATLVASPFDVARVPREAPLRPLAALAQGRAITAAYRAVGGVPAPLLRRGRRLAALDRYLTKPWTVVANLHDRELLAQIEAVDRFMRGVQAYPGRRFGQLFHRFLPAEELAGGQLELGGSTLDLARVHTSVLAIAGEGDGIAPVAACHHVAPLLPHAHVRVATAPGGHLGVLTGRAARKTTWTLVDEWLDRHAASPVAPVPPRSAKAA
jgi:polyhydroxyalkanoate synthase